MPQKPTRKSTKRKLDKTFNKYVRERDKKIFGNKCPLCYLRGHPVGEIENAGHWQTSVWEATRWDEENCTGICAGCNIAMEGDKDFMAKCINFYKKTYGEAQWDAMVIRSHTPIKRDVSDLQEMIELYEHKTEDLKLGAFS